MARRSGRDLRKPKPKKGAAPTPPSRRWIGRIALLAFSLLLAEGFLRLACFVSSEVDLALSPPSKWASLTAVEPDSRLKYRGRTRGVPEHDSLGFRNPKLPQTSPIVAIGDSQTYGTSVDWREAWPWQLGRLSGISTYNMGCSGWGPIEYREVLNDALKLQPKLVVVGLYLGNDMFDAYRDAYFPFDANRGTYTRPAGADLIDSKQHDAITKLERDDPFLPRIGKLYEATKDEAPAQADEKRADEKTSTVTKRGEKTARSVKKPDDDLDRFGKLYALGRATWNIVSRWKQRFEDSEWTRTKEFASQRPNDLIVVDVPNFRSVLTPAYRGIAVDRSDLRIREGERIALAALAQMSQRCRESDCQMLVVLIPTKESVYADVEGVSTDNPELSKLLSNEQKTIEEVVSYFEAHDISYVDARAGLRACVERGVNPYLPSTDGHPSGAGQRAIAATLAEHSLVKSLAR